jgi:hypothetical protein
LSHMALCFWTKYFPLDSFNLLCWALTNT